MFDGWSCYLVDFLCSSADSFVFVTDWGVIEVSIFFLVTTDTLIVDEFSISSGENAGKWYKI